MRKSVLGMIFWATLSLLENPWISVRAEVFERDIIAPGHYYLAIDSETLANEYRLLLMTSDELKESKEYKLYHNYDTGEFQIGIDLLLQFRAESYCRFQGFQNFSSFEIGYSLLEKFPWGRVFVMETHDNFSVLENQKLFEWKWSPSAKKAGEKYRKYFGPKAPHIFFTQIHCKLELPMTKKVESVEEK